MGNVAQSRLVLLLFRIIVPIFNLIPSNPASRSWIVFMSVFKNFLKRVGGGGGVLGSLHSTPLNLNTSYSS